ncbi:MULTISPECIES: YraN family protein [unclassified Shewanella]|jgi:putative endonuclease|uniref:YraN family protein n=1 Tax=unclassified Shewanella TaxID=196818 RepID=UPI00137C26C7|nr:MULTISPECIES: YraN family protein [unclassified Shewanella]MBB1360778.1 YraN family protein [Shewanella sp. SR44-4]MBO1896525.1 YraN family protein [Shewanella sp. BF02_Schw]QHS11986.1 YraN family protein [Shewanella sp. Arc9-LZ]
MNSGQLAEQRARTYLEQQGLTFVDANVRYPFGEIDLIMRQQDVWVFVEVKFRSSNQFGGALNALTSKQITRIRLAAEHYLQRQKLNPPCRFDVIAMNIDEINWLQGCF